MKTMLILLISILTGSTCSDDDKNCHDRVIFTNNTNETLYVMGGTFMLLSEYSSNCLYPYWHETLPNEKNNRGLWNMNNGRSYCFENTLKDTLRVFIFEGDIVADYAWEEIVDKYMVLQRYDLSLQDLQQLNWQISYPPSELMKNMKMYPPYQ